MDKEALRRAMEINEKIKVLKEEITEIPRYILDYREYKKSGHMYVARMLQRKKWKFSILIPKGYYVKDLEFELSEEDLQALVNLRRAKIEKLEEELKNL